MTEDLIRRLRAGEAEAAREIEERYRLPLVRYAHRFLDDGASAEDVAQEVLVRALGQDDPPQRLKPWLYRAVRNRCLNHLRDRGRRPVERMATDAGLAESRTGHLTRLVRAEQRAALARYLDEMPPQQREVLDLRYGEDLSRDEIAEVLGLESSVVKSRLYEGMKRLREKAAALGRD